MNCARGENAILIRKSIKHYEVSKISSHECQALIYANNCQISLTALYSPPRHNIKEWQYKELFKQISDKFIIGGDCSSKNTHWGSRSITTKFKELFKASQSIGCSFVSTGTLTYWPTETLKIN